MLEIRRHLASVAFVLVSSLLPGCSSDETTTTTGPGFTIRVAATSVTSSSIHLDITASFNAFGTPFWRTDKGWYLAHFDLQANTPSTYVDTDVTSGTQYCYRAGGSYFLIGDVYSNLECVTTP